MLLGYHFWGSLNSLFIFVSLIGVYAQLRSVWKRKSHQVEQPTHILSLNQFSMSFMAYLSFFVYGYSIEPFNHYIVWPRLIASLLVLLILFEIFRDRKTLITKVCFVMACVLAVMCCLWLILTGGLTNEGKAISSSFIVIITLLLAQGYISQIRFIIASGETGAVNIRMSQFILMMDILNDWVFISYGIVRRLATVVSGSYQRRN